MTLQRLMRCACGLQAAANLEEGKRLVKACHADDTVCAMQITCAGLMLQPCNEKLHLMCQALISKKAGLPVATYA